MKLVNRVYVILAIIFSLALAYLLFVYIPQKNNQQKNSNITNILIKQHSYLLKTKLSTIEHLRLDPNDPQYNTYKQQIESRTSSSIDSGLEHLNELEEYHRFDTLVQKTKTIYKNHDYTVNYLVELTDLLKEYLSLIQQTQSKT